MDWAARADAARRNGAAALSATLVQLPQDAIYGLLALAPLGPAMAPQVLASTLLGTIVANVVLSLAGSRYLVGGPRAALALLVAGLCASLARAPALQRPDGTLAVERVLAMLALGVALAGVLQLLAGRYRIGQMVKYLPYPVRAGFMTGVGVLLMLGGIAPLLGLPIGTAWWRDLPALAQQVQPAAIVVGLVTYLVMRAAPLSRRLNVPAPLLGMLAGMALHHALAATWGGPLGDMLDAPAGGRADVGVLLAWPGLFLDLGTLALLPQLLPFAFAVALLASLETLMSASVVDGLLHRRRDGDRELIAQGWSNLGCALVGGQPSAGATARSLILVQSGGRSRWALWGYTGCYGLMLYVLPQTLSWIPASALGGAFLAIGLAMVDDWSWGVPRQLLFERTLDRTQRRLTIENWLVMLLVAGVSILAGLSQAVLVGVFAAMVLFVRSNSRALVRSEVRGDLRRSLCVRPPQTVDWLRDAGHRIVLLELEGALFFGTADGLAARVQRLAPEVDVVVLDLRRVKELDGTGARILLEIARDLDVDGKQLVIAELPAEDPRRRMLDAMDVHHDGRRLHLAPDVDRALEWAEDRLLATAGIAALPDRPLALAETVLADGLDEAQLAALAAELDELHFAAGTAVFRAGEPGDALYLSTQGTIAVLLPGSPSKRIAAFAPGVIVGEMALLEGQPRSADAYAEGDVTVLRLSRQAFERLRREHPALAATLLLNVSRQLSSRLRHITVELAGVLAP